jgi:hypothetical protein
MRTLANSRDLLEIAIHGYSSVEFGRRAREQTRRSADSRASLARMCDVVMYAAIR